MAIRITTSTGPQKSKLSNLSIQPADQAIIKDIPLWQNGCNVTSRIDTRDSPFPHQRQDLARRASPIKFSVNPRKAALSGSICLSPSG
ncbi:hypothetical protein ACO22_04838 [Paracoccidioides brasiliensis]|uniref:Uncharacterized protein n=1 Tax=Paracoccidioides brasiliensis TaxID=121759 RepID=A0A1D2JC32_PARBR|nr:hypothetical protein ACO22_04838 [Paracoccidioides brasiliensis]